MEAGTEQTRLRQSVPSFSTYRMQTLRSFYAMFTLLLFGLLTARLQ